MYSDDDGFVNPKKIMRMIGASDDDLKVLIGKRFVLTFENGVVVIKHWKINNLIRKDFYQKTVYQDEKKLLEVKENGAYTECSQIVNNLSPQYSIGKDRLGKDRIDNTSEQSSREIPLLIDLFKSVNPAYKKFFANKTQRGACERMLKENGFEKLKKVIDFLVISNKKKFAPTITTPLQLEDKFGQLKAFWEKESENKPLLNI